MLEKELNKSGFERNLNKMSFPKVAIGNLQRLSFTQVCRNSGCVENPRIPRAAIPLGMTTNLDNNPLTRHYVPPYPARRECNNEHLPPHEEGASFKAPSTLRERAECVSTGVRGKITLGFTLIELLVIVLIIGILAAVALPQYQLAVAKSKYMNLVVLGEAVRRAEWLYYLANGKYTSKIDELDIRVQIPQDMHIVIGEIDKPSIAYVNIGKSNMPGYLAYLQYDHRRRQCFYSPALAKYKRICENVTRNTVSCGIQQCTATFK